MLWAFYSVETCWGAVTFLTLKTWALITGPFPGFGLYSSVSNMNSLQCSLRVSSFDSQPSYYV